MTFEEALENAYMNAPMTDFHQYRAKVTGYSPAANRYFVRRTAPVGKVPTSNWNEQKSKVPGYTQPSNQYFATRARLAYSPPKKTFGGFSGSQMTIEGLVTQKPPEVAADTSTKAPPPPPQQVQEKVERTNQSDLEKYEEEYLARLEKNRQEAAELADAAAELAARKKEMATKQEAPKEELSKAELAKKAKTEYAAKMKEKGATLPKGWYKEGEVEANTGH